MTDNPKEKNIPVLKSPVFKEELIDHDRNPYPADGAKINDFFIHTYKEEAVPLKLSD